MPTSLPSLPEIERACREAGLSVPAPELHGGLCGWLAGGGDAGGNWLSRVMVDDGLAAPAEDSALARMRAATVEQFADRDFGLELLGPAGEASLARSEEHTSELQSRENLVCRLLLEKKKNK